MIFDKKTTTKLPFPIFFEYLCNINHLNLKVKSTMKIPQIIEGNKHLFGTYSTMALANIRNILDHIATLACIENDFNADSDDYWHHPCMEIINPQNLCNDVTKADFVTEKLKSHFPFVVIMAEAKRQKDIAWAKNQAKKAFENRDFQKQQEFNLKSATALIR